MLALIKFPPPTNRDAKKFFTIPLKSPRKNTYLPYHPHKQKFIFYLWFCSLPKTCFPFPFPVPFLGHKGFSQPKNFPLSLFHSVKIFLLFICIVIYKFMMMMIIIMTTMPNCLKFVQKKYFIAHPQYKYT